MKDFEQRVKDENIVITQAWNGSNLKVQVKVYSSETGKHIDTRDITYTKQIVDQNIAFAQKDVEDRQAILEGWQAIRNRMN